VEEEGEEQMVEDYNNNLGKTVGETKIIDNNLVNQQVYTQQPYYPQNPQNDINSYLQSGNFISTASAEGAIDLNNLQPTSTTEVAGNEDLNKYFEQGAAVSNSGNYNYNLENISAVPVTTNAIDYNQYSTNGVVDLANIGTASTVPAPTNIDLNNYGIQETGNFDLNNYNVGAVSSTTDNVDLNNYNVGAVSSTTDNVDLNNYNVGAVSSTTNNVDFNNLGFSNTQSYSLPDNNLGSTVTFGGQGGAVEYNTYETSQVSNVQNSYASPIQSYSYNYSYNVGGTSTQSNY
jgi:hypothetical protein